MGVTVLRAAKGKDSSLPGTHSPLESADFARGVGPHIRGDNFIFVQFFDLFCRGERCKDCFSKLKTNSRGVLFNTSGLLWRKNPRVGLAFTSSKELLFNIRGLLWRKNPRVGHAFTQHLLH